MNKNELQAEMKRRGHTYETMAKVLGISQNGFWRKVNGLTEFTLIEIQVMIRELEIDDDRMKIIFFS